jgi:hypothetical protein
MESKARSISLFYRASYRKTASHFTGRTLGIGASAQALAFFVTIAE